LKDFFNLPASVGTISNAEAIVSEALKAPVEEAKEHIKKQPCVNADETGHKQQGNKMWSGNRIGCRVHYSRVTQSY